MKKLKKALSLIFKKNDKPFIMYDRQVDIISAILDKDIKWLWISAPTRYGKSEIVAIGALFLASMLKLRVRIVGATSQKANKIMEYILEHVADNELIYDTLINKDTIAVKKLKILMRKSELRWMDGGWISVLSAQETNTVQSGSGLLGEGGDVIIIEEAGLLKREETFNKIVRMREPDNGYGKLIQVGNLIEGTIFEKAYNDKKYTKIFVTLEDAKREKKWTDKYIAEQKSEITTKDWKRLYAMEWVRGDEYAVFKPQKYDILPKLSDLEIYGAVDLALGKSNKGSKIAIVVLGKHKDTGQIYEIESIIKHMRPNEAINTILNLPYPFVRFGIENVQFQQFFVSVIDEKSKRLGKRIPFEGVGQGKQKVLRIESMEPVVNTGQIYFKENMQLWNDLRDYPDTEFLDGLDALEMCYRLLNEGGNILIG